MKTVRLSAGGEKTKTTSGKKVKTTNPTGDKRISQIVGEKTNPSDGEKMKTIILPLSAGAAASLRAGDTVLLSGELFTARDAAHKRLCEMLSSGSPLPLSLKNQTVYYVGPTPAPLGRPIGSCGPTTSARMDGYTPALLELGLKGMIGKGERSRAVIESIKKNKAVYFAAIGGAGALYGTKITAAKIIAFEDLLSEAIYSLTIKDFLAVVAIDSNGNSIYK
jgi:fumarate hydratase subunit beta